MPPYVKINYSLNNGAVKDHRMKTSTDFVLDDQNAELEKARKFSCTCQHNKCGPCYKLFSLEEMGDRKLNMAAMTQ